jgi:predicted LPLAT superfamily acyltransferase
VNEDDLVFAGVARQAELLRSRAVSSRELVELYLRRISLLDPVLNAFRVVFEEESVAAADRADPQGALVLGGPDGSLSFDRDLIARTETGLLQRLDRQCHLVLARDRRHTFTKS